MIAQRESPAPVPRAVAEALPFAAGAFDAALAVLTLHHWTDWPRGVAELLRVARSRVVILTWDPEAGADFWLFEYFPQILALDRLRIPLLGELCEALPADSEIVPIPHDCCDGFLASGWCDPARYLDAAVRAPISGFRMLELADLQAGLSRLAADLAGGSWSQRWRHLGERDSLDCGYRLVVADLAA